MTHKLAANIAGVRVGETEYCRDCFDMLHQKNRHADEIFLKGEASDFTIICSRCSELILQNSTLDKDELFEGYDSKTDTCYYCVENAMAYEKNGWHCHFCGYWNVDNKCYKCNNVLPRSSKQR